LPRARHGSILRTGDIEELTEHRSRRALAESDHEKPRHISRAATLPKLGACNVFSSKDPLRKTDFQAGLLASGSIYWLHLPAE
jgi:hypothetical protein